MGTAENERDVRDATICCAGNSISGPRYSFPVRSSVPRVSFDSSARLHFDSVPRHVADDVIIIEMSMPTCRGRLFLSVRDRQSTVSIVRRMGRERGGGRGSSFNRHRAGGEREKRTNVIAEKGTSMCARAARITEVTDGEGGEGEGIVR